jgi:broad specificity phosphatase PhoE
MLHIVRHGRTEHNASGLLLGRIDPPLDDLGRDQAAALAATIGPVDRLITSPLLRTRQTAEAFGIEPVVDERWIELDYGAFDGVPLTSVEPDIWKAWRTDADFSPPGGESLRQLGQRVSEALTDLDKAEDSDLTTVVVTHVSPIKAAVCWALGVDELVAWRLWVATASITSVAVGGGLRAVHGFNDIAHLRAAGLADR